MQLAQQELMNYGRKLEKNGLYFNEGELTIKTLVTEEEKRQGYHLRHQIFCKELQWVSGTDDELEIDNYDDNAEFLGILDKTGRLVAYIRIILPQNAFMLEKEFLFLVSPEHRIRKESDTAEITRLCVIPELRGGHNGAGNFNIVSLTMLLFKGIYLWCRQHNVNYLYFVVEYPIYMMLRRKGFPCELIGNPYIMPDGIMAVALFLDGDKFELENSIKRPELLRWFNQCQSDLPAEPWKQLESC